MRIAQIDTDIPETQGVSAIHETQVVPETEAGGLATGVKTLGIDAKLLAAQVINFFILLFLLQRFVYKPLVGLLEKRRSTIDESLQKAQEIERRYHASKLEQEEILKHSRTEAASIIEEAKEAAETLKGETLAKTREENEAMLAKAKAELERQRQAMLRELKHEVGSLVVSAVKKITLEVPSEKAREKFIKEALEEVGR